MNQKIRRFQLIITLMETSKYPKSVNKILNYLAENDINISKRTLMRDFSQLRTDHSYAVEYDKKYGGYYVDRVGSLNTDGVTKALEILSGEHGFEGSVLEIGVSDLQQNGFDYIERVLEAIKKGLPIRIIYSKAGFDLKTELTVVPLDYQVYMMEKQGYEVAM